MFAALELKGSMHQNKAAAPDCESVADIFDLKIRTFIEKQRH
jgi:hypothetical protein